MAVMVPNGIAQLEDWMRRRGFTRADAARYLDFADYTITNILKGKYRPGLSNALKIERLTGIPVEAWAHMAADSADDAASPARKRQPEK